MTKKRPVVGIDIDGVLADFGSAFYQLLDSLEPGVSPHGVWEDGRFHPDTWYWAEEVYSSDAIRKAWQMVADPAQHFWRRLDCTPEAGDLIRALRGYEVYAITVRSGTTAYQQTREWLDTHGFDGSLLIARGLKGYLAAGLGLTHFLDDNVENCESVRHLSPSTRVWLARRRYNRWFSDADAAAEGIEVANTVAPFIRSLVEWGD